jgi:hypothetical protein
MTITTSLHFISKMASFPKDFHERNLMYTNELAYLHKHEIYIYIYIYYKRTWKTAVLERSKDLEC